jgi:hypothetical protein
MGNFVVPLITLYTGQVVYIPLSEVSVKAGVGISTTFWVVPAGLPALLGINCRIYPDNQIPPIKTRINTIISPNFPDTLPLAGGGCPSARGGGDGAVVSMGISGVSSMGIESGGTGTGGCSCGFSVCGCGAESSICIFFHHYSTLVNQYVSHKSRITHHFLTKSIALGIFRPGPIL